MLLAREGARDAVVTLLKAVNAGASSPEALANCFERMDFALDVAYEMGVASVYAQADVLGRLAGGAGHGARGEPADVARDEAVMKQTGPSRQAPPATW